MKLKDFLLSQVETQLYRSINPCIGRFQGLWGKQALLTSKRETGAAQQQQMSAPQSFFDNARQIALQSPPWKPTISEDIPIDKEDTPKKLTHNIKVLVSFLKDERAEGDPLSRKCPENRNQWNFSSKGMFRRKKCSSKTRFAKGFFVENNVF